MCSQNYCDSKRSHCRLVIVLGTR
jgi:hypothetical protein